MNRLVVIIIYVIPVGAFIDAIGGELRSTPMHWATRQGHLSMVVLLVQHVANPNILDGEGASRFSERSYPILLSFESIF